MDWVNDRAIRLCHGSGDGVKTACWMTAVSMYAGKAASWGDQPSCVSPTIRAACIRLNDAMTDAERTEFIGPRLFLPVGTGPETREEAQVRAFIAADYAVRVILPIRLRALGREDDAVRAESVAKIVDRETAKAGQKVAESIRATYSAGGDAAAALAAAAYADTAAAYAAADTAAYAAAAADAYANAAARRPIFAACMRMIDDMCAVGRERRESLDEARAREVCEVLS